MAVESFRHRAQGQCFISWPVVAAAGVLSLAVVTGLAATAWVASRSVAPANESMPALKAPVHQAVSFPIVANPVRLNEENQDASLLSGTAPTLTSPSAPEKDPDSPASTAESAHIPERPEARETDPLSACTHPPTLTPAERPLSAQRVMVRTRHSCETYGTNVAFMSSPAEAGRQALCDKKLLLVLHVSGNFEDAQFT